MASSATESPSSLPTRSSLRNSKYLSPMIMVLTLMSRLELFLKMSSSLPNLSMLLSQLVAGTLDLGDLCMTFIELRLKAKALDSRPMWQLTTPNTTFFFVFITTANRNLFCRVGRQFAKFLQNSSYLKLSLVLSPFTPKNLQHSSSRKDLSLGIFQSIAETLKAVLAELPALLCRKEVMSSMWAISGWLPNTEFKAWPIFTKQPRICQSSCALRILSFSRDSCFCLLASASCKSMVSWSVFILSARRVAFQLRLLAFSTCSLA